MLRRLHPDQPDSFAFTPANKAWAEAQIAKFPPGRQASAIIPLLWRAQEQEGWLTRPAIEHVADMLGMAHIRALEVATFYFMFQLSPVGSVAHVQVCGTTPCMLCGSEALVEVLRRRIAKRPHARSADGKFSWEEVECLGACANAPMAQIGKDYYEDLTPERLEWLLDELDAGRVPAPGPQNGRYSCEPAGGLTSLKDHYDGRMAHNASVALALELGDTVARIDGGEVPLVTPWRRGIEAPAGPAPQPRPAVGRPADDTGVTVQEAPAKGVGKPQAVAAGAAASRPAALDGPRQGVADDLKRIKGVGPKLESLLHALGVYHYDQIAGWSADEVAWMDEHLEGFRGRVTRDDWIAQAGTLAAGGETEFSARADGK